MIAPSPIKRLTLAQQIKEVLLDQITAGDLKPGDRLIELKIAKEMNTSQAPVREALRELEAVGVIEIRRNRGAVIRDIKLEELSDIYKVLAALEGIAAAEVAKTAPHLGIKLLAICDRMEASERMQYRGAFGTLNHEFHEVIVRSCSNQTLIEMWEKLHIRARTAQNLSRPDKKLNEAIKSHRAIAEAISGGDTIKASTLITTHIEAILLAENT